MSDALQDFPTDDETLDLLEAALTIPNASGATGIGGVLDMLAGIDPTDRSHLREIGENIYEDDRPSYHPNDVLLALIHALREERSRWCGLQIPGWSSR